MDIIDKKKIDILNKYNYMYNKNVVYASNSGDYLCHFLIDKFISI